MSPATSLLISHTNASGTIAVSFSYVVTFKRGPERKRQLTSTNKYWYFFGLGRPQSNGMWIQHPGITNFISKWSFPTCCVGELAKQGPKCTFGTHGGWMFFHDRRLLSAWFYLERFHHGWWKRSWHLSSILQFAQPGATHSAVSGESWKAWFFWHSSTLQATHKIWCEWTRNQKLLLQQAHLKWCHHFPSGWCISEAPSSRSPKPVARYPQFGAGLRPHYFIWTLKLVRNQKLRKQNLHRTYLHGAPIIIQKPTRSRRKECTFLGSPKKNNNTQP